MTPSWSIRLTWLTQFRRRLWRSASTATNYSSWRRDAALPTTADTGMRYSPSSQDSHTQASSPRARHSSAYHSADRRVEPIPVLGKDLFKDVPVRDGCCHHQAAPRSGCWKVCGALFYHASPTESTPSSAFTGHAPQPPSPLSYGASGHRKMQIPVRSRQESTISQRFHRDVRRYFPLARAKQGNFYLAMFWCNVDVTASQELSRGVRPLVLPRRSRAASMLVTAQQTHLARRIDTHVRHVLAQGGGDEAILLSFAASMGTFKPLLDTCTGQRWTPSASATTASSALPGGWSGWQGASPVAHKRQYTYTDLLNPFCKSCTSALPWRTGSGCMQQTSSPVGITPYRARYM